MTTILRSISMVLAGVVTAVMCSACSSDDPSPGEKFISQYCDLMMGCCEQAGYQNDPSQCKQFFGMATMGATYHEDKGNECLAAAREANGSAEFCSGESNADGLEACQLVFTYPEHQGSVQPGGACEQDSECVSTPDGEGKCVHRKEGSTCVILVTAGEGAKPCYGEKFSTGYTMSWQGTLPDKVNLCDATQNLYCDYGDDTCKRIRKAGESCAQGERCELSAYCDSEKKCHKRLGVGETCEQHKDQCSQASYCSDQNKCAAKKAAGEPCGSWEECLGNCKDGVCEGNGGGGNFGLGFICVSK